MGLFDFLKRAPTPTAEGMGMAAPMGLPGAQAPPTLGIQGIGAPPGFGAPSQTPSFLGGPQAMPMFPQNQPMPSLPFSGQAFSPTAELREIQTSITPTQVAAPSDDLGRKIGHLEDKMEIMNEKLDLILREIRNIYEREVGRRI